MLAVLLLCSTITAVPTANFEIGTHTFTLPRGFVVEQVAGPPLVERPIVAAFDEEGRLHVADSSGSNDKVEKQLADKPHRILRLEDIDGDGRFDRSIVYADGMMFPEGVMWLDGSLYVAAPPSIWKLTDNDGDGVADHREEWFRGKTLTGCANDLHGPYRGPDGWIYWCKGAFARQSYDRPGSPPFTTRAAHIFRCRPDGSGVEPVMTGGMDNPVDVVFTPRGERIFTTTFLQHPGGGKRDGLIHAIYGGVYGKRHDVLDDHPMTGDLMPVLTHLGPAAPCGLTTYTSPVFGADYQDNLFAALFNMQKVTRHVLEPAGATFRTRDSDFLVSDNRDFHPTDVLEDADSSLLVIDTGGWYKLCCPTSQLYKPDVLGAIYRVRRAGATPPRDPRGSKLDWKGLAPDALYALLDDPRPAVRGRAMDELGRRGGPMVAHLASAPETATGDARRNAVWALTRIAGPEARAAIRAALSDGDESVRQAAVHAAGLWRDPVAVERLLELLERDAPAVRRAAAEALGRIGDGAAVERLLASVMAQEDRILEHSLIYALIEIAAPALTASGVKATSPSIQRAALIALDQMSGSHLKPETVMPFLTSADPLLRKTASWIARRHPDWGGALAGYLAGRLATPRPTEADRLDLEEQLAVFARAAPVQEVMANALLDPSSPLEARTTVLRAIGRSDVETTPPLWSTTLARVLSGGDSRLVPQVVSTARKLRFPEKQPPPAELVSSLVRIGGDAMTESRVRLDALAAVPGGIVAPSPQLFRFLQESVEPAHPVSLRTTAARILASARLDAEQLLGLTHTVRTAGPLELTAILAAFEKVADERVGLELVDALKESSGVAALHPDAFRAALEKFPESVSRRGKALLESLDVDMDKRKAHIDELLASLENGDVRRGQTVFNSPEAACASCHEIGYLGGDLGPDLTRIGQIRSERDLLEALVYPSASFVRSYEPTAVVTRTGKVHNGILRKDGSHEVVLVTGAGPGAEVRIARKDIVAVQPGTVSVMPAGLDRQLSRRQLADLLAFLKATR